MADPLSIAGSVVAIVTAAVQSVKSLHDTVTRFKGRDKTLQRLQNELQDISNILDSLAQVMHTEASISALLQGPIDRCSKICQEFEQSMKSFNQKNKTGFLDWAKLEFMRGDINEFIDTISGYKSTISVGIGTITIQTAKISQQVLEEYNEMIHDTVYSLNIRLQRVDEKLEGYANSNATNSGINLDDEKEVTKLCLRICEDAKHFLESLKQKSTVLDAVRPFAEDKGQNCFDAQLLTHKTLDENRDSFANIISQLRNRLEFLVSKNDPDDGKERSRLLEDINASKQCLEICKVASQASPQKIYRIGEVVSDGDSDQVVVTTLADLFDIKKAISRGTSTQLVGSMTEAALIHVTDKRYASRPRASAQEYNSHNVVTSPALVRRNSKPSPSQTDLADEFKSKSSDGRPSSNEIRKRTIRED